LSFKIFFDCRDPRSLYMIQTPALIF